MYDLVSDVSGNGLRLAIDSARGAAVNAVDAGEDGRFSFQGVASGTYHVRARAIDGATGSVGASIPAPGVRAVADVDLKSKGATLDGRVVHSDGSPWRGDVLVLNRGEDTSVDSCGVGVVETDSEGKFSFVGLTGSERLVAMADALNAEIRLALASVDRTRRDAPDQAHSHTELVRLLEAGEVETAATELAHHLHGAEISMLGALGLVD